jgi:outer membrane receptor protein involved in Fe transport
MISSSRSPRAVVEKGFPGSASRLTLLLGTTAFSAIACASPAQAQAQGSAPAASQDAGATAAQSPASAQEGQEILVTARRRSERIQDVPVAITALPAQALNQYVVTSVTDLSRFVPGMVVGKQVTGSAANIFLRGIGSSSQSAGFDQSVSVNINGIPMSRGRELSMAQFDLDHVEVLRGPQALFFGKNTTGGLVSIITHRPTDTFEASLRAGWGIEGEEAYGEAVVSGPIADGLTGRVAIRANHAEGLYINTSTPNVDATQAARAPGLDFTSGGAQSHRRGFNESISGRATLEYKPTPQLDVLWITQGSHYNDHGAAELYERICGSGRTVPRPTNNTIVDPDADCARDFRNDNAEMPTTLAQGMRYARDGRPYTDFNSISSVLDATYNFGQVSLNSLTGYYWFGEDANNTFNGSTRTVAASLRTRFHQFSQELRLTSDFGGAFDFMVGGFFADQNLANGGDTMASPGGLPADPVNNSFVTYRRDGGFSGSTYSAFAELIVRPIPQIEIDGGARWSRETKDSFLRSPGGFNSASFAAFPPTFSITDAYAENNISPQVTVMWRPSRAFSLYGAYKQGFKAGGFNISTAPSATVTAAQNRFRSETAEGWEGGIRAALFNQSLHLNLTAFDYTYKDLQVQFFDPTSLANVSSNAGRLTTRGIEGDFELRVPGVRGLEFHGSGAYNHATYHDFIGLCYAGQSVAQGCDQNLVGAAYTGQSFEGRTPPKAPRFSAQLGSAYEVPVSGSLVAGLTADMTYVSSYNFADNLRPDAIQSAFARLDGSISIRNRERGWRLALIGRNLTNHHVVTSTTEIPFTNSNPAGTGTAAGGTTADFQAIVDSPREIYVEFSMDF